MIAPLLYPQKAGLPCPTMQPIRRRGWLYTVLLLLVWCAGLYYFTRPYNNIWQALYHNAGIPEGYEVRGIDVSHYQGEINWERVCRTDIKDAPVSFVIMKATEGVSIKDKQFPYNFKESLRYGLLRGAYHFFTPSESATKQAAYYTQNVHLKKGDLPPVLDIEEIGNLNPQEIRDAVLAWLLIVEDHYGATPILYTYLNFKERYLNGPEFERYPFWIAHYYVPKLSWTGKWNFWQHTDRGRLPGIQTFVDFNVYNGSMYSLQQLCLKKDPPGDSTVVSDTSLFTMQ